jgi:uncharacterized coiled-coil protein SlyX
MTSEDVILEKIEHLSETVRQQWEGIKAQSEDIGEIKKTVSIIAVQSNRIDNLSGQVSELWTIRKTHDEKISEIEKFQASCPRDIIKETQSDLKSEMRETMKRQWVIISLLAMIVLGSVWKVSV